MARGKCCVFFRAGFIGDFLRVCLVCFPVLSDFAISRRISGNRLGRATRESNFGSEVEMLCVFVILVFRDLFDALCPFFAVLLFLGSVFGIHFRERTFIFFCFVVVCCCFVAFCLCFCYMFCLSLQDIFRINSLDVRSSLFLWFAFRNPFLGVLFPCLFAPDMFWNILLMSGLLFFLGSLFGILLFLEYS